MTKNNKLKQKRVLSEDMTKVKNLIILLILVVGVIVGLYFLTDHMIKTEDTSTDKKIEATIDYDIATVGTMFNRIEEEYFVLLYSKDNYGSDLDSVLTTYRSSDNYVKTYFIDLDKKINSSALSEELVKYPNNSNEVKVNEPTLYKINNGKVINCYSGVDNITNVLK